MENKIIECVLRIFYQNDTLRFLLNSYVTHMDQEAVQNFIHLFAINDIFAQIEAEISPIDLEMLNMCFNIKIVNANIIDYLKQVIEYFANCFIVIHFETKQFISKTVVGDTVAKAFFTTDKNLVFKLKNKTYIGVDFEGFKTSKPDNVNTKSFFRLNNSNFNYYYYITYDVQYKTNSKANTTNELFVSVYRYINKDLIFESKYPINKLNETIQNLNERCFRGGISYIQNGNFEEKPNQKNDVYIIVYNDDKLFRDNKNIILDEIVKISKGTDTINKPNNLQSLQKCKFIFIGKDFSDFYAIDPADQDKVKDGKALRNFARNKLRWDTVIVCYLLKDKITEDDNIQFSFNVIIQEVSPGNTDLNDIIFKDKNNHPKFFMKMKIKSVKDISSNLSISSQLIIPKDRQISKTTICTIDEKFESEILRRIKIVKYP